jgi:acyl-CoA reductase-like NAD-dependent aldehyde dehydrogenase
MKAVKINNTEQNKKSKPEGRIAIPKTYKLFIGGKFPRTESGRYFKIQTKKGIMAANICLASRKDFKGAVISARKSLKNWSGLYAYTRGLIIYRIAEILEGRRSQFIEEMVIQGYSLQKAKLEVDMALDRIIYYAGWADKYQQIFSSVNPVSSSHFNFSVCEPTGVIAAIAPENFGFVGLVSTIIPLIAGGNTVIVLAPEKASMSSITLGEIINTSDVPAGVVNILTGKVKELMTHFATHMDVNAIFYGGNDTGIISEIQKGATSNLKRVLTYPHINWEDPKSQDPYYIMDAQEIKTIWHPVGF